MIRKKKLNLYSLFNLYLIYIGYKLYKIFTLLFFVVLVIVFFLEYRVVFWNNKKQTNMTPFLTKVDYIVLATRNC